MTSLALADTNGQMTLLEPMVKPIRERIRQGRDYRRRFFEPGWQTNLAFASGQHWLVWHGQTRTLRTIQELDPRYKGRELVTADVITEYRTTALGELGSDNDRPELLLRRDDQVSEDFQEQLNRAMSYGWDHEWDGDDALAQVDRYVVDLGTAAIRCRFDPTVGPVLDENIPHLEGKPVYDLGQATQLMGSGPNPDVTMQAVRTGRICWEPLSAFNIIVPPGAVHEKSFAWEAVVRPTLLVDVKELYGAPAVGLVEDNDISTSLGISTSSPALGAANYMAGDAKENRLRDHCWLFSYYERPTQKYPQGREITFAGNDLKVLEYKETLPYVAPDGTHRSGIAYFHWWRVTGRFWSRALMDVLKDGQRGINKRRTQINEIIDRNMPYVIVQKDSQAKRRQGLVNEIVEIDPSERAPQPVNGIGPGPWMQGDVDALREDLAHASGIAGPRRGENPPGVTTYAQLSLLNEADTAKREPIYLERKRAISQLVEDTVYDIRTYWGRDKQIALAGDDDRLEAITFDATKIPTFFIVQIGKGVAKPRSPAAELQKVTDIWNAAVLSAAVQASPAAWIQWYKDSFESGEALELPNSQVENPGEKAEYENHYLQAGVPMPIAYYDVHAVHLPIHRRLQDMAMFGQDMATWQLVENHCQLHINAAQAQAAAQLQMQAAQTQLGGPGGGGASAGQPSPPRQPGVASPPARPPGG
jgi:hypothetical protein